MPTLPLRAVLAFLALPGMVGFVGPWLIAGRPAWRFCRAGLYRWSRNPMYVGVTLILWGWAVAFHSQAVWIYAAIVMIAFQLRVVLYEEPWLERTFPEEWTRYRSEVRRWL